MAPQKSTATHASVSICAIASTPPPGASSMTIGCRRARGRRPRGARRCGDQSGSSHSPLVTKNFSTVAAPTRGRTATNTPSGSRPPSTCG